IVYCYFFFFQAEDGIRDFHVTGVQTCALPILASVRSLSLARLCCSAVVRMAFLTAELARKCSGAAIRDSNSAPIAASGSPASRRSEERRVGKECRARGGGVE